MDNLLLRFFLPAFDGSIHAILQCTFAAVFIAAVIVTPRLVARSARSEHWERRLAALDDAKGPVPAYASIDDLGAAVATPAERWADALPSLLLVFGLLGTFVGLGLALTEAAGVLGPGNDALSGLTPIMDSLGSKFKTSTWGILAFLGLKIWSMARPYEERRLAWSAGQIHNRTARAAEKLRQQKSDERRQLIEAIAQSGGALLAEQQRAAQVATSDQARSQALLKQIGEQQSQVAQVQRSVAGQQLAQLEQIAARLAAAGTQQEALVARTDAIAAMSVRQAECAEAQLQRTAELAADMAANRSAMEAFVNSVTGNIATMAKAADNMATAADAASKASTDLGAVIGEFRSTMINVLGDVRSGLGETIEGMRDSFATNMHSMADNLSRATNGIEHAISQLSTGVASTIEMLEKSNQESVKRQTVAQATFAASGEELMGSMGKMQSFVELMQQKTEAGLTSVAKAGQQMAGFDQRFAETNEHVRALAVNMNTLANDIRASTQGLRAVEGLGADIAALIQGIERQHQAQLETETRHQRQLDESERLAKQVVSLSAAIASMVDAQQKALRQERDERTPATLERIETALAAIVRSVDRTSPAVDASLPEGTR